MIEISSNIQQFINGAGFRKLKRAYPTLLKGIQMGMRDFEAEIIKTQFRGRPGLQSHGNAVNKFFIKPIEGGYRLATSAFYLTSHQHAPGTKVADGWIHAKNGKYLAIPLNRYAAQTSPRSMNLNFAVSRNGNFILYSTKYGDSLTTTGGKAKFTPQYLLKTKVYIPKRLHILEDYRTIGQDMIRKSMLAELTKLQNGGNVAI
jgi:hypothetical protein